MKRKLILGCLLFALSNANAQSLSPFVIATSGDVFSNSSGSLSFTIGEMAMIQTFSNSNNILTQGFQQPPSNFVTAVSTQGFPGLSVKVFPNPTTGKVFVSLITPSAIHISGILYDAMGRTLSAFQFHQSSGQQNYEYNWGNLTSGIYIMEFFLRKQPTANFEKVTEKIIIKH